MGASKRIANVLLFLATVCFVGRVAASQTLYTNKLTGATCFDQNANLITIVTDGLGDFNCSQTGFGSVANIETRMVGTCQNGYHPDADQYVFLQCVDQYGYQADALGSYFEIEEHDECGNVLGYDYLGYIRASSEITYAGEPISSEWSADDCDGNPSSSEPGIFITTSC